MIRVNRSAVQPPGILVSENGLGLRERARAEAFYQNPANREKTFPHSAYSESSVKSRLNELFGQKCAYCEITMRGFPFDVEHYRPKGGVVIDDKLRKPGYYWLAAEWDNLLPACIDCNRERYHDAPDVEPELVGKANKFPIANPGERASQPGEEQREKRLLLHPCRDHPESALTFDEDGFVHPAAHTRGLTRRKAQSSIEVYGLNRPDLRSARREYVERIAAQRRRVEEAAQRITEDPADEQNRRVFAREVRDLLNFRGSREPFQALVHQHTDRFLAGVELFIREWFREELDPAHTATADLTHRFLAIYAPEEQALSLTPIMNLLARRSG